MLLKDLAELAGVSVSTVSRALHDDPRISEATKVRIRALADREHFVLSKSASALASRKSFRITALFVDYFNTWFTSTSLEGLYSVISQSEYDLFPLALHTPEELDKYFQRLSRNNNTDGIIIASIHLNSEHTKQLSESHIPVVGLDSFGTQGYDSAVVLNNRQSMTQAAQTLKELGHHRIGFVHYPQPGLFHDYSYSERIPQFEELCISMGFSKHSFNHYASVNGKADAQGVASIINQWRSSTPRPTVLFVETDDFAITVMVALRDAGFSIPRDISIVGFDDNPVSQLIGLTTFHQDALNNARHAASMMLDILGNNNSSVHSSHHSPSSENNSTIATMPSEPATAAQQRFFQSETTFVPRQSLGDSPRATQNSRTTQIVSSHVKNAKKHEETA